MPLNVTVSIADAYRAFGNADLKSRLQQVRSGFDKVTGLPQTRPSVEVTPPPTTPSATRRVTWNLNMQMAESDEDDYEAFAAIAGHLVDGAQGLAAQFSVGGVGIPFDPKSVVANILSTMKGIDNVLEESRATKELVINNLKVGLDGRAGKPVTLTGRLLIRGAWLTDDPNDGDNKAWFELESFEIGTLISVRASPNKWDASTWDSSNAAPSGHEGRSFMESHGESDFTGDFKTQPGSTPKPELITATAGPINEDSTTVNTRISANIEATDTVVVVIRQLILEISGAVPESEEGETAKSEAAKAALKKAALEKQAQKKEILSKAEEAKAKKKKVVTRKG